MSRLDREDLSKSSSIPLVNMEVDPKIPAKVVAPAEAEPLYQQALALRQKLLGDDHPDVATSFNDLHLNQQQYAQAEGYLERSLGIYQIKLGSDHPYTQEAAQALQQARAMQVFEGQRSQLKTILDKNPDLRDQLQTGLQQYLNRDPTPDELLMALMQIFWPSQAGDDPE